MQRQPQSELNRYVPLPQHKIVPHTERSYGHLQSLILIPFLESHFPCQQTPVHECLRTNLLPLNCICEFTPKRQVCLSRGGQVCTQASQQNSTHTSRFTTSHYATHHTTPHHTIPYHTTPHPTTPHHTVPHHTTPHHTAHHTTAYNGNVVEDNAKEIGSVS